MLYVQENTHSTLLLSSMLSTPPVHPQPSSSTSSRSTKVVEQLQDTLETLQKEVISTRSQVKKIYQNNASQYSYTFPGRSFLIGPLGVLPLYDIPIYVYLTKMLCSWKRRDKQKRIQSKKRRLMSS